MSKLETLKTGIDEIDDVRQIEDVREHARQRIDHIRETTRDALFQRLSDEAKAGGFDGLEELIGKTIIKRGRPRKSNGSAHA